MIRGYDVSHHQDPKKWDWELKDKFMIARASYGKGTPDKNFVEFAQLIRDNGLVFGAYHFYRQVHSVEEQLALFDRQLDLVDGLQSGDLYPVLDMEHNGVHGDGAPKATLFSESCRRIAEAWRYEYGGCILYYSSYFPEWLRRPAWMKEDGYYHWLADYNRDAGNPRTPYTDQWHMHQFKPQPTRWYNNGIGVIDQNVVNPAVNFDELRIKDTLEESVTEDAVEGELDTDGRPGGALHDDGLRLIREGVELVQQGLDRLDLQR